MSQNKTVGNIRVIVAESYDELGKIAAQEMAQTIKAKPNAVLGLATGSTPLSAYRELIELHKEGLDFGRITTFNLDEYYPIKKDNSQSYHYFMYENFFNHINVNKDRVNILNGEAEDWEKEILEYEEKIVKAGGIDLQLLGIGGNGHIAFNEPAPVFQKNTALVDLTEDTIKANARFFEKQEDVPRKALSMGIKSIMMAEKIVLLANGSGKREAVLKALFGEITPSVPASVLQLHRNVTFIVDEDAWEV